MTQKVVLDTQLVACMNPSAGSFHVNPRLQRHLTKLALPAEMDFLYANRYRKAKGGYIRFHHDQLTKMGPVVAVDLIVFESVVLSVS